MREFAWELRSLVTHDGNTDVPWKERQISKIEKLPLRGFGFALRATIRKDHDGIDGRKRSEKKGDRKRKRE